MRPLVVIVGETASGKSGLGMEIARRHSGEIIAADSRTVYKYFDIGTAKPTKKDQAEIAHHLLDVVEPNAAFNAAQFKRLALRAIEDIHSRSHLPVMVGGTGLYIDSVIFDFEFAAKPDPQLRSNLSVFTTEELQNRAEQMGAVGINFKNRRHVIRFIETGGTPKQKLILRDNTLVLGLQRSKNELRKRIEDRVEQIFRAGLRKEIDWLVENYGWDNTAMSGVVYRLFKKYEDDEISMSEVKRMFVQKDLQYAKRQRTWFKRNPYIQWHKDQESALKAVASFLAS